MATWELNVNNSNNGRTTVYVMEDDESGIITTPEDLFKNTCFSSDNYIFSVGYTIL